MRVFLEKWSMTCRLRELLACSYFWLYFCTLSNQSLQSEYSSYSYSNTSCYGFSCLSLHNPKMNKGNKMLLTIWSFKFPLITDKTGNATYNVTMRLVHETIVVVEKQSVCTCVYVGVGARARVCACTRVVLRTQRSAILSCAASMVPPCFSTLSHKRHDFRKKSHGTLKMCSLIFSTTFIWNIPHSKMNSGRCCHKCRNVFT